MNALDPKILMLGAILFPVTGLLINLIIGKWLGQKAVGIIASLASGLAFAISLYLMVLTLQGVNLPKDVLIAEWGRFGSFSLAWAFRLDTLALTMMLVVSGVGTLIHIYSIGYMHKDTEHNGDTGRFRRFFIYLNLFIASMMTLVSANNYFMLFVGWEGVGLCSYLLIGFWYEKGADGIGNAKAAKKAFVVNRIGDFGLLLAIFILAATYKSLDFGVIFSQATGAQQGLLTVATLLMLVAVAGKSAQLPLFVWLPDAMAGPTPVSALIHAATMVTAGVYLVVRSQALFIAAPVAGQVAMWLGAITALFAATIALAQNDIKKVLAYSTISQLGFMVAAVGMGAWVAGIFHLVTHAFFKALLFLGAGSVIQGMERGQEAASGGHEFDPQDMRQMGGLRKKMPLTFIVYLLGAFALAGIAPLAGFFSKDEIVVAAHQYLPVFIILVFTAFLTALYSGRHIFMIFGGTARSKAAENASDSKAWMTVPLIILAVLTVFGGALNIPNSYLLEKWLERTLTNIQPENFVFWIAGLSLGIALLGILIAWFLYGRKAKTEAEATDPMHKLLGFIHTGMEHKWYVDEIYNAIIIKPFHAFSEFLAGTVDQKIIDGAVNGAGTVTSWSGKQLRKLQTGYLRNYVWIMLAGIIAILAFILIK